MCALKRPKGQEVGVYPSISSTKLASELVQKVINFALRKAGWLGRPLRALSNNTKQQQVSAFIQPSIQSWCCPLCLNRGQRGACVRHNMETAAAAAHMSAGKKTPASTHTGSRRTRGSPCSFSCERDCTTTTAAAEREKTWSRNFAFFLANACCFLVICLMAEEKTATRIL